jgi:hypothetical protein
MNHGSRPSLVWYSSTQRLTRTVSNRSPLADNGGSSPQSPSRSLCWSSLLGLHGSGIANGWTLRVLVSVTSRKSSSLTRCWRRISGVEIAFRSIRHLTASDWRLILVAITHFLKFVLGFFKSFQVFQTRPKITSVIISESPLLYKKIPRMSRDRLHKLFSNTG